MGFQKGGGILWTINKQKIETLPEGEKGGLREKCSLGPSSVFIDTFIALLN